MNLKWKRILCLCLCLGMLLTAAPGLAAADSAALPADTVGRDAYGLTNALKVTELLPEELNLPMTRGALLKAMCLAGGFPAFTSQETVFYDLPLEDENEPYIKTLVKLGLVEGTPDGRLFPNESISLLEASAVAVKILGYTVLAQDRGGYPAGYWRTAQTQKLLEGLPLDQKAELTNGMAARLLKNLLEADALIQTGFGSNPVYSPQQGITLLESVFHVRRGEAVLDNVDLTRLMGKNDVQPFHVELEGQSIDVRDIPDIYDYLGYEVEAYWKVSDSDEPRMVYMYKTDRNQEYVLDVENITDISGQQVWYQPESGKTRSYRYRRGAAVIYNGTSTGQTFSMEMLKGLQGSVRLLDNNGDRTADVIFVELFETYLAAHVDMVTRTLYDAWDSQKQVVLDTTADDPYTVIYNSAGEEIYLGSIAEGSLVSVFCSALDAYQKYRRAYVNTEEITGLIEEVWENGKYVVVGGVRYQVTPACMAACAELLRAGQTVTLQLDYSGKVGNLKKAQGGELQYGFLAAVSKPQGAFESSIQMMVYSLDGAMTAYEAAKNIRIDNNVFRNDPAGVRNWLHAASGAYLNTQNAAGEYTRQIPEDCCVSLVRYAVDMDGRLAILDTILNEKGVKAQREDKGNGADCLFMAKSEIDGGYRYRSYNMMVGPHIAFVQSTQLLRHPSPFDGDDMLDPELYTLSGAYSTLVHNTTYELFGFYTDPSVYTTEILTMLDRENVDSGLAESQPFAVVDEVITQWNEQKEIAETAVVFLTSTGKRTFAVKEGFTFAGIADAESYGIKPTMTAADLVKGDIVRYNASNRGYLSYLKFYYRTASQIQVATESKAFWAGASTRLGYVFDKFENGILVYYTDSSDPGVLANVSALDCELVMTTGANPGYYAYDVDETGTPRLESSAMSELRAYRDTGADCSRVFVQTNYGTPLGILSF